MTLPMTSTQFVVITMKGSGRKQYLNRYVDLRLRIRTDQTQGTFAGQGRDDILTTTIEKPEHPGRVRGVPRAIGLRDYFVPTQKNTQTTSQDVLRQMDLQWEERLNQSMRSMEQRFIEQLQEQKEIQRDIFLFLEEIQKEIQRSLEEKLHSMTQDTMGFPTEALTAPRVSTRRSCFPVEPTEYNGQTIHSVPILPQHVRVTIDEVRDPQAQVPVPTPEIHFVGEAIGSFIAWTRALIMSHIAIPQKQSMHEPIINEDDEMAEAEDDPLSKL
ncbi:hypothetical protein LR48_Vigan01g093500 [Vigna angularis]|uniref:DUF8039 domain-containing protein n=1 Tax=Phaseolus angularis TaxID=3914 RepID=A0A0L9TLF1_PHAAN|nr:hypothetical protein LR48_Vigan01g093500 [Vigna angularis]